MELRRMVEFHLTVAVAKIMRHTQPFAFAVAKFVVLHAGQSRTKPNGVFVLVQRWMLVANPQSHFGREVQRRTSSTTTAPHK